MTGSDDNFPAKQIRAQRDSADLGGVRPRSNAIRWWRNSHLFNQL